MPPMSVEYTNIDKRPLKRQKCEVSCSVDFASLFSFVDNGVAKHLCGDYNEASVSFCQALHHASLLFVQSDFGVSRAGEGEDAAGIIIASRSGATTKCPSSAPSVSFEAVSVLLPERHTSKCPIQTEYDEGMRPHTGLLRLKEPTKLISSSEADWLFLAASLCFNIAQTFVERELYIEAIVWFHHSLDKLFLSGGKREQSIYVVKTLHCLGFCHYRERNDIQARLFYGWALSLVSSLSSSAGCSCPALRESVQMHLAASLNCVAVIIFNEESCKTDEVLAMFNRSLHLISSFTKHNKQDLRIRGGSDDLLVSRATVLNNIGRVYFLRGEFNEAVNVYEECLALRCVELDTGSIDLGATHYNIGMTYFQLNRFDEALSHFHEFLSTQEVGRKSTGSSTSATIDLALVHKGIGDIHVKKSESQLALYHFTQALENYRASQDTHDIEVASLLNHLGSLKYKIGDFSTAIKYYEESLQIEMRVLPPHHSHITITLKNMGHIYRQLGEYKNALAAYQSIYEVQLQTEDPNGLIIADTLACIGLAQYNLQDYESSFESYQEALRIRKQKMAGDDHLEIAAILTSIGIVLFRQDRYELSKQYFDESLRIKSKILGNDNLEVATLWYNIASIYFATGEYELAIDLFGKALRSEEKSLGIDHPDLSPTLQHLAQVYQHCGEFEISVQYYSKAVGILQTAANLEKESPLVRSRRRTLLNLLGNVYLQLGMTKEMMQCYVEACRMQHLEPNETGHSPRALVEIVGYNFYGLSKTNPPSAPAA